MRRLVTSLALLGGGAIVACGSSSSSDAPAAGDDGGAEASALDPNGAPPACSTMPSTGGGPPGRGDAASALDATGTKFVIHGGDTAYAVCPDFPTPKHVGDSWVLDVGCGAWHSVPGDNPGARARAASVTDTIANRALVFGGRTRAGASGAYTTFGDLWAFDFAGETWTELAMGGGPKARSNTAIVFDAQKNQLVLFGGNTSTDGLSFEPQSDTWTFDLASSTWSKLATKGSPPARLFHAMAFDPDARRAYVFSGGDANAFTGPFLQDTWALDVDAATWTEVKTKGGPPQGRIEHAVTFDTIGKRLVVFGGHDDGQTGNDNEVWTLDVTQSPAVWTQLPGGDKFNKSPTGTCGFPPDFTTIDKASPERRSQFAFGARADGRAFFVWSGKGDCGILADGWWWAGGSNGFSTLMPNPISQSCLRVSTTCTGLCG